MGVIPDFLTGVASSYGNAAASIAPDVEQSANEIAARNAQAPTLPNEIGKAASAVKAGGRLAGDFAGAVFAPISSAIGAALKATGAQGLIDDTGNVVANSSGITDIPAFQKFAMSHPNAGADFQRLLNIGLSGGADPSDVATKSKAVAEQLVTDAQKNAPKPQITTSPSAFDGMTLQERLAATAPRQVAPFGDTTLRPLPVTDAGGQSHARIPFANEYSAPENLPTINFGKPGKGSLPTIQIEPPARTKFGSLTYEPIEQPKAPVSRETPNAATAVAVDPAVAQEVGNHLATAKQIVDNTPNVSVPDVIADTQKNLVDGLNAEKMTDAGAAIARLNPSDYKTLDEYNTAVKQAIQSAPKASIPASTADLTPEVQNPPSTVRGTPLKQPREVVGEGNTSKAASDLNTRIARNGLESLPEDQLARFTPIEKANEIVKVSSLLDRDPDTAAQAALGHVDVPDGIHPQVLFNAVANAAEEAGNLKLMADLARSPLATARSEAAQTLSASGFNLDSENTVSNLQRIRDIKSSPFDPAEVKKARTAARTEAKAVNLSKEDLQWGKFLDSIKC